MVTACDWRAAFDRAPHHQEPAKNPRVLVRSGERIGQPRASVRDIDAHRNIQPSCDFSGAVNGQSQEELELGRRSPSRECRERLLGKLGLVRRDGDMSGPTREALDDSHEADARIDRVLRVLPLTLDHADAKPVRNRTLRVVQALSEAAGQGTAEHHAHVRQALDQVEGRGLVFETHRVEVETDIAVSAARGHHVGEGLGHRERGSLDRDVRVCPRVGSPVDRR